MNIDHKLRYTPANFQFFVIVSFYQDFDFDFVMFLKAIEIFVRSGVSRRCLCRHIRFEVLRTGSRKGLHNNGSEILQPRHE